MALLPYKDDFPSVHPSAYTAPSANIIGNVTIGQNCSVWPMVVIRGDMHHITIGANTSIQDGSVLHITHDGPYCPGGAPLHIGNNVTVGHNVTLHACTIEDLCLIGIGSIVMDRSILQSQTLLAAGSLVPPGKTLEGGYLWAGSPAKKIRPLTDKELAFFEYSAKKYVSLKNDYLAALNN